MTEPAWDHGSLRAWFEARKGQDILETELLAEFFPGESRVGLALFHQHFLLYRRLWLFDDELRQSTGHRLWIRGIRSTLVTPPPACRCGWLNPETGEYCLEPCGSGMLCPHHDTTTPEVNGMKSYYLDDRNLVGMTEQGVQDLMESFFRWMGRPGEVQSALATMGLNEKADPKAIKDRWRRLSQEHHPDKGGDPEFYQRLSAAWAVLKSRV